MSLIEQNGIVLSDLERITQANLPWSKLSNKIIMVTGGSGFLASYLVKSLLLANKKHGLNLKVICVIRNRKNVNRRLYNCSNHPNLEFIEQDIGKTLREDFPRADYVIHSASQASPKYYGTDPVGTLMANVEGTKNLLNHSVKEGCERFLFFSSGEVYGKPVNNEKQVTEIDYGYVDSMKVRSCYAESKRMGETMCAAWAKQYGIHTNVVRPFHTYGPGMALDDGRVFADFVSDIVSKRNIVLKSDGMASRPFCYIADATIGFLTVLLKGEKTEAYNVGNPDAETTIKDLAMTLTRVFRDRNLRVEIQIPIESNEYIKSPIERSCPSIEKIKRIDWRPTTGIKEGFRRTVLSYEVPNKFTNEE
tara:strand:- start:11012 stop:12100 length:1089 start_codon:yes stop_codon:yes gene_type:complete